ncbi:Lysine-specific demethylase 3A [Entophlyctis luteolus]|nr:Lysine-specific demethylase 3A [Entophlyctis luteolus]
MDEDQESFVAEGLPLADCYTHGLRSFLRSPPPTIPDDSFYFGYFMDLAIQRIVVQREGKSPVNVLLDPIRQSAQEILAAKLLEEEKLRLKRTAERKTQHEEAVATFNEKYASYQQQESANRLHKLETLESFTQVSAKPPLKKAKLSANDKRSIPAVSKKNSPCFRLFKRICISCFQGNVASECRLSAERDLQGNISFGAELTLENQITRPRGIDRIATRDEDKLILQHAASALVPLLSATVEKSLMIPAVDTFKVRIRPKTGYIQCDSCEAFIFLDHVRCMDCGQDFCLDCFEEWTLNPTLEESSFNVPGSPAECYRRKAFATCSLESTHVLKSFSFWTFMTPSTRRFIHSHAEKNPLPKLMEDPSLQAPILFSSEVSEFDLLRAWRRKLPIVVSNIQFSQNWEPQSLQKAAVFDDIVNTREKIPGISATANEVTPMRFSYFVEALHEQGRPNLVGFDFPVVNKIDDVLPEHWKEYRTTIPFRRIIMRDGALSLFSFLSNKDHAQIHGATLFIGGPGDTETGTTRLHKDSASAYNTLVYAQHSDRPGAVWHLFKPADVKKISQVYDRPSKDNYTLLDFSAYLDDEALAFLERVHGVKPIVIEQRVGDMILIPAGYAHQVRNYQLCVKISQDVVSSECLPEAISIDSEIRLLPPGHDRRSSSIAPVGMAVIAWDRLNKYSKRANQQHSALPSVATDDVEQNGISGNMTPPEAISSSLASPMSGMVSTAPKSMSLKGKLDGRGRPGIATMMIPVLYTQIQAYSKRCPAPTSTQEYLIQNKPCHHPFFSRFLRCGICHPRNPAAGSCVFVNTRVFARDPEDPKRVLYGPWFLNSHWNIAAGRMVELGIVDDKPVNGTDQTVGLVIKKDADTVSDSGSSSSSESESESSSDSDSNDSSLDSQSGGEVSHCG